MIAGLVVAIAALSPSASAGCDLSGPLDAPFRVPVTGGDRVRLVIELWTYGAPPDWAGAILDVLDQRGMPAMIVVPAAPPDPPSAAALDRVHGTDHGVAVVVGAGLVPTDPKDGVGPIRRAVDPVRDRVGAVRTVIAPIGSRVAEAMLGRAGFRSLISTDVAPGAAPRMAGTFEGQPRTHVVLPPGAYEDACGVDPRVGPFGPAAGDRVGLAIQRGARANGTPVVRLALDGARGAPTDAAVLARWLDTIVTPGGIRVVTAERARLDALQAFHAPATDAPLPDVGGRIVAVDEVVTAAGALVGAAVIPRTFPGDLQPTEAFYAFALVAANHTEGVVVRLGALRGPAQLAQSTLSGPTTLSAPAVRAVAAALVDALPTEVPAAMSVDGHLLAASELLTAFAAVVRGDDPVVVQPIGVPEPNERGLGWGDARVP